MERVFRAMHLQVFVFETFRRHARNFIEPAIVHTWNNKQDAMLDQLSKKERVILGGDMRAEQTLQSNQVSGSYYMELKGLQKGLDLMRARNVTVESIVTDRHPQVQKFLCKNDYTHWYDVWHFEKGLFKKIEAISKIKNCGIIKKWLRGIKLHVYWTAQTSRTPPERRACFLSILNHVRDVHHHDDPHYPACEHQVKQTTDGSKWLKEDSEAFQRLEKVISNKRVLNDVVKLSPHHQTSTLESYHSVILRFTPKNVAFPYIGMLCRLYLATIHFNENADRPQARSSDGTLLFKLVFPKALKGECRAKPVKEVPTFRYVDELMDLMFDKLIPDPEPFVAEVLKIEIPPDLSSQYACPDREEFIVRQVARFNHQVEEEAEL